MTKTKTAKQTEGEVEPLRTTQVEIKKMGQRISIESSHRPNGKSNMAAAPIMQMDEHEYAKIESISTGALSLDIALGGAGIPRGRISKLFGPKSSGKTTLIS